MTPSRPGVAPLRLLPALALAVLALVAARWASDRDGAAASAALGLHAAGVLGLVALSARRRLRAVAGSALLVGVQVVWGSSAGPIGWATISAVLAASLALVFAERVEGERAPGLAALLPLALAALLLARAPDLVTRELAFASLVKWTAAACLVALALAQIGRLTPRFFLPVALASVAAAPALGGLAAAALVVAALVAAFAGSPVFAIAAPLVIVAPAFAREPAWVVVLLATALAVSLRRDERLALVGRSALAGLALVALVAGSAPWSRRAPIATTLAVLAHPPTARLDASPVGEEGRLTVARPRFEVPLAAPMRGVAIDSALGNGAGLPCGTRVASVRIERQGATLFGDELLVGAATADWAALRPDVAPALACPPPAPHAVWPVAEGRILAARYRAIFGLAGAQASDRLIVERAAELPADVELLLFAVGVER